MSGESPQPSVEALLQFVRLCKSHLLYQRDQGWDGVPRDPTVQWGGPYHKEVTTLLLEGPSPSSAPQGDASPRRSSKAQRASQKGGGLELMRDAMSSLGTFSSPTPQPEQRNRTSSSARPSLSSEKIAARSQTANSQAPREVVRVSARAWAQEPALPLHVLRELPAGAMEEKQTHWEAQTKAWRDCERCARAHGRSQVVMGEGPLNSRLMLVAEGPSSADDREGSLWSGEQGRLLALMARAIGLEPTDVYLTSVVHCFRSQPKVPQKQEIEACFPLLEYEINIVQPEFIVTLGAVATQSLLRETKRLSHLRGAWHPHHQNSMVFPTFSPAYLLKRPAYKGKAWEDWQAIREKLLLSGCETKKS